MSLFHYKLFLSNNGIEDLSGISVLVFSDYDELLNYTSPGSVNNKVPNQSASVCPISKIEMAAIRRAGLVWNL